MWKSAERVIFVLVLCSGLLACSSTSTNSQVDGDGELDGMSSVDIPVDRNGEFSTPSSPLAIDWIVGQTAKKDLLGTVDRVEFVSGKLPYGVLLGHRGLLLGRPVLEEDTTATLRLFKGDDNAEREVLFHIRSGVLAIAATHPPAGEVGTAYEFEFQVFDAEESLTWSVSRGALPPGLSLDAAAGIVSGTPTADGIYPFVVDAQGVTSLSRRAFAIRVGPEMLREYSEGFLSSISADGDLAPYDLMLSRSPDGMYGDYGDSAMWNGTLLAGLACRYQVLRTAEAQDWVRRWVNTSRKLTEVTGMPGLLCRGYELDENFESLGLYNTKVEANENHHVSTASGYEEYRWQGDVSRDQMTGQVMGNALAFDALDDNEAIEQAAENLISWALHVWDHQMQLVDPDGERTKHGDCSAQTMDGFPLPNGVNAALTGAWLLAGAYAAEGRPEEAKLAGVAKQVLSSAPPAEGAENPGEFDYLGIMDLSYYAYAGHETKWFNVNLSFNGFFSLVRLTEDGATRHRLIERWTELLWTDRGEELTKRRAQSEGNPWFTFQYMGATARYDADAAYDALWQMVNFMPPPRVAVDGFNSTDPSIAHDPEYDLWAASQLPAADRCSGTNFVWQRCPYELDCGGDRAGDRFSGSDFVAPYWMGVLYGYVSPLL